MSRVLDNPTENKEENRLAPAWLGPGIVGACLVGMLAMTWRTWCEPVVDFGRELYVPWQLAQGKVLYRDIAYFNGPLSPYFNSILFRIFGVSLMTLVYANIAILCGVLRMLYVLIEEMAGELSAAVGCCAFVLVLAVGQPGLTGNYNFITPYSHEMTHGVALSLGAILCLVRFGEMRKRGWIAGCGALVGLVFLTKPEIFLAAGVATAVGVFLATRESERPWVERSIFVACAIAVVLVAVSLLCLGLPIREAASGVLRAWKWAIDSRVANLPFYQRVRGTFDLEETAHYQVGMTAGYLVVLGLPALIARYWPGNRARRVDRFVLWTILCGGILLAARNWIKWEEAGRPVIVVAAVCVVVLARHLKTQIEISRFTFALFSLVLLAKTALDVRFYHYGFALTAPGLVLAVMAFVGWLPKWIDEKGGSGAILRGASIAAIVVMAGTYVYFEHRTTQFKTVVVGSGGDAFYATAQGATIDQVLKVFEQLPASATVAVAPEGAMVNYLSRRENSTPFIVLMPPEVIIFSQGKILEGFQEHPPDYVVYLGSNASEYGFAGFVVDYGKPIFDWILANYHPLTGNPQDPNLKWMVFQRNRTGVGEVR